MYAGFWQRFVAYLIDLVLVNVGGVAFIFIWAGVELLLNQAGVPEATKRSILGGLGVPLFLSISWLYFALLEASPKMATVGKMAVGAKVVDVNGNRISFGRATVRYLAKLVLTIIFLPGCIFAAFTDRKQALHDLVAKTLVIRANNEKFTV